jgi:hypothetical protein
MRSKSKKLPEAAVEEVADTFTEVEEVVEAKVVPVKKTRRRSRTKPGDGSPPKKLYFNSDTQAAIVLYQGTTERKIREKIYVDEILPAFKKLVENLINIHKFKSMHDSYDDLRVDCVNFLFETIEKFDATRGTNAFSYFNVVAKNWLIIKTKQRLAKARRSVSLDDIESMSSAEAKIIEEHCTVPAQDVLLEQRSSATAIVELLYEIRTKSKSENELTCINSIIAIFENIDNLDLLNKGAILLYLRELSGLSPKQLTTTMQSIKKHYRRLKCDTKFRLFD